LYPIFDLYGLENEILNRKLGGIYALSSQEEILKLWNQFGWKKKFEFFSNHEVSLSEDKIECLKNSREKTSIWKLILTDGINSLPVVLKIFKPPFNEKHSAEINMYRSGYTAMAEFMPKMYWIEERVNDGEIWLFTEFIQPLRGQIKLSPKHLDLIIPTVAKFHARTFGDRITRHHDAFDYWLPRYDSAQANKERSKHIEKTKEYLDLAMKDPGLREIVEPGYNAIQTILQKGPIFFPEIMEAGQCLIHGDLHLLNLCCQNGRDEENWNIQMIDWESAKYAPCLFDMVVLVELLIDFRTDWHKKEDEIRSHCMLLYTQEMQKEGITFQTDTLKLLKMTYLQRTLEKRLLNHLRRVLNGEQSVLLKRYIKKINSWGKELGLY
jgi:hypothetical protein